MPVTESIEEGLKEVYEWYKNCRDEVMRKGYIDDILKSNINIK